nr:hypothetical protein [uncultured Flavobacterium sp.]
MKIVLKFILVVVFLIMLVFTSFGFVEDVKVLFTYESADYLSDITNINVFLSLVFMIIYLTLLIYFWKRLKPVVLIFFFIFSLWFISGRTLAFKYHPTGRIIVGWYYIQTEMFNLCKENQDYEKILSKETEIKELFFWRLNFKNKDVDETIFIGPFVWDEVSEILNKRLIISKE